MPAQLNLWNDGLARNAIVDFVAKVTAEHGPDFVPPADRIATFDNDGTLWCEKPLYIQLDFVLGRLVEMAEQHPELRTQQPWQAAATKDYAWLDNAVAKHYRCDDRDIAIMMKGLLAAFAGLTIEEFAQRAGDFLRTQPHPKLNRLYRDCCYAPMIELLRYLEAHGFTNYIVSGGGRDFMRPVAQEFYGIPPERVVGSSIALAFRADGDGGDVLSQPQLDVLDDGPVKPTRIWSRIGKRPIFAAGNTNGDIPMLQFANKPPRPAFRLLVLHDDGEREFAYATGAEKALELAGQYGWTIGSMRNDWRTIFAG